MKIKEHSEKMGLQLNLKNTKLITTGTAISLNTDRDDIDMVNSFSFSGLIVARSQQKKYAADSHLVE